ncbi:MAG: TIGR01777 family oxidoreductase [Bacteroidetes bacterium]|nr:TIGR01777 family oxidoreductase [Bacteroidota bacterium]
MNKSVLITGATGLIGKKLVSKLCEKGSFIKVLTTNKEKATEIFKKHYTVQIYNWKKYEDPFSMSGLINEVDAVVNLAGTNISSKRWNKKFKSEIYNSRINITHLICESIKFSKKKPECFINSSGIGIYGFRKDELLTEDSETGKDFLARLCTDWESEAIKAFQHGVRVVTLRTGIVLDSKEGALPVLIKPFRYFAGGYQGSGKQWISWIHIDDIVNMIIFALNNTSLSGALNVSSPEPVTNRKFAKAIGSQLGRPSFFPVPSFVLRIIVGEFAVNLIHGQKAYPKKAFESGFTFEFPYLKDALKNLLGS